MSFTLTQAATLALRFTLPEVSSPYSISQRKKIALYLLTLVTIIFRSELALLLAGHCLQTMADSGMSLDRAIITIRRIIIPSVLTATVASLSITVAIDTYMWQSPRLIWPELAAFLANIFPKPGSEGASAWGTSPWHWYLTSALPRLTASPLILATPFVPLLPEALRRQLTRLLFPAIFYVATYSILPHKETRFLFPIMPTINTGLSLMASWLSNRRQRSVLYLFLTYLIMISTLISLFISHLILLPLSALTYPGGAALQILHSHAATLTPKREIHVHLTNLALQTGVTRFLKHSAHVKPLVYMPGSPDGRRPALVSGQTKWVYDKSHNGTGLYDRPEFWERFDYVVVEDRAVVDNVMREKTWDVVGEVLGLGAPVVAGSAKAPADGDGVDGLALLLRRMYGDGLFGCAVLDLYRVAQDVLLRGKYVGLSITRGHWLDWRHDVALVVLQRRRPPTAVDGPAAEVLYNVKAQ
jgi:alpha-1,6-mannosyltransferase